VCDVKTYINKSFDGGKWNSIDEIPKFARCCGGFKA
jgi:hypothetical protein